MCGGGGGGLGNIVKTGISLANPMTAAGTMMGGSPGSFLSSGGGGIGGMLGDLSGANAAIQGSQTAAAAQQRAEDYLNKQNQLPVELQQGAFKELGGLYGLPGFDTGVQSQLVSQAQNSPIYKAMLDQINQGLTLQQNQIGSSAAAKGLLGSGNLANALARQQALAGVDKSQALAGVYQNMLGGIQGLSQTPTQSTNIAQLIAGKGMTLGQGQAAAGQANAQFIQGLLQAGGQAAAAFSDIRLKDNVRYIGEILGHKWFTWDWNSKAEKLGLKGKGEGVMAHLVEKYAPEAIGEHSGYMTVNYAIL